MDEKEKKENEKKEKNTKDTTSLSLLESLHIFIKGIIMGIADIIPGVSGGTLALIMGIYERLIAAIGSVNLFFVSYYLKSLFAKDIKIKKELKERAIANFMRMDFIFLIPLAFGILLAFGVGSKVIPYLMENYTVFIYAFFLGLIVASTRLIAKRKLNHSTKSDYLMAVFGFVFGYAVVSLTSVYASHSLPVIFLSGFIAICAMILPGISGSFILLILGQYDFILNAVHDIHEYYLHVGLFIIGCLFGLLSFSRAVKWLLQKYHDKVIMFLVGLMIGSLKLPFMKTFFDGNLSYSFLYLLLIGTFIVFGVMIVAALGKFESGE